MFSTKHFTRAALVASALGLMACNAVMIGGTGQVSGRLDTKGVQAVGVDFIIEFETPRPEAPVVPMAPKDEKSQPAAEEATATDPERLNFSPAGRLRASDDRDTVDYDLSGKIRALPIHADIARALAETGQEVGVGVIVVSAGQVPHGTAGSRTGSIRHDVRADGTAMAADIVLVRGGRRITPLEDEELYRRFLRAAGTRFTAAGHYAWGLHLDRVRPGFWGPDKTAASANPRLRAAFYEGRQDR